jgi:ABC-type multidrug transport system fused ATPase/permease subunit
MQRADQILVLRSGAIVERGTHEELLLRGERYTNSMVKGQTPNVA